MMKIIDSLERIGDLSGNVAEVVAEIGDWNNCYAAANLRDLVGDWLLLMLLMLLLLLSLLLCCVFALIQGRRVNC